jgi:type IV pilus secretin PilQ/predicted competence protein
MNRSLADMRQQFLPIILMCLAMGMIASIFGCSSAVEPQVQVMAGGPSQEVAQPKASRPQAAVKEPVLQDQPFRIQELSVLEDRGQTTLYVKFSSPVSQYRHFTLAQPSRVVLDIFGDAKRLAEVENYRIDTSWVGTLRLSSGEGYLRLVMEIAAATVPAYVIDPENGGLKVVIGSVNPQLMTKRELQLIQGGRRADVRLAEPKPTTPDVTAQAPSSPTPPAADKPYAGQRISLDFKDADIKNVFRLLAEVSGLNIIVTPDVQRKVTVRLIDVPWDQAMDLLVDTNGLGKEQLGNVVRISTAAQIRAEKDAIRQAKAAQENLEPLQTIYLNVNYANAKDLVDKVKPALSSRGIIVPDERSNTILVRDIKKGIDEANAIISKLDTRTPQVLIESNLIETTPTFARALGLRFQLNKDSTTFSSSAGAGTPFSANPGGLLSLPSGLGGIFSIAKGDFAGIGLNLASALEAAETEGNIKIISRPSVVTLNNIASTIQSLRIIRIALPTSTNIASGTGSAAGSAVATEKINVGIILTVTPQVSSDGFVLMKISVKSSTIADSATATTGGVIPFDELSREAIANVLVRDGETIVIGGIMKDTKSSSEQGVPYLKDIPVLGWLFKNTRLQKDFEELMVFITPRIVAAGSENLPNAEQLWREQMKKTYGG